MFNIIINVIESIIMFLFISLLTWRIIDKNILESKYLKSIIIFTGVFFVVISNILQIFCFLNFSTVLNKIIGIVIITILTSVIFSGLYSKFKNIPIYILSILGMFCMLFLSDLIVIMVFNFYYKDIFAFLSHYKIACVISLIIKSLFLIITILIKDPKFFKFTKDKGVNLLASTVMMTATKTRYYPSWFFFYQAKAPKCLDKKNNNIND